MTLTLRCLSVARSNGISEALSKPSHAPHVLPPARPAMIGPQAFPPGYSTPESDRNGPSFQAASSNTAATANHGSSAEYKLYGVLVHRGLSANSGHYYAFVQAPEGQWTRMNDATCYSVSAAKVLAEGAYLLFYVRTAARHYVPIATQARLSEQAKLRKLQRSAAAATPPKDIVKNGNGKHSASSRWETPSAKLGPSEDIPDPAPFGPLPLPAVSGFQLASPTVSSMRMPPEGVSLSAGPAKRQRLSADPEAASMAALNPTPHTGYDGSRENNGAGTTQQQSPPPAHLPGGLPSPSQLPPQQQQQQQQHEHQQQQVRGTQSKEQQQQWQQHGLQVKGGFAPTKSPALSDPSDQPAAAQNASAPLVSPTAGSSAVSGLPLRPPWAVQTSQQASTSAAAPPPPVTAIAAALAASAAALQPLSRQTAASAAATATAAHQSGQSADAQAIYQADSSAVSLDRPHDPKLQETAKPQPHISDTKTAAVPLTTASAMQRDGRASTSSPAAPDQYSFPEAAHTPAHSERQGQSPGAGSMEGLLEGEHAGEPPPPPPPPVAPTLEEQATAMFPMEPRLAQVYQQADQLIRDSEWPRKVKDRIRKQRQKHGGSSSFCGKAAMLADLRAQIESTIAKEMRSLVKQAVIAIDSER